MSLQHKKFAYPGAGIILTRGDSGSGEVRVLLLKGRSGIWSFSKGHPERQDHGSAFATARRETLEETGFVHGRDYTIRGSSVRYGKRSYWVGVFNPQADTRFRLAPREHCEAAWLTLGEIAERVENCNKDVRVWVQRQVSQALAPPSQSPSLQCV